MRFSQIRYLALILFSAAIVIACRGVNSDSAGGSTGELTIAITDGPADTVDEFNLFITGIELTADDLSTVLIEDIEEEFFDIAELQGGLREEIISGADLADGTYQSLRLIINETDSKIFVNGSQYPITIPASEQANLEISLSIFLDDDNDEEDFTIDLDLRKSIRVDETVSPPVYTLHPRLRVVETSKTGTLTGTVDADLITNSKCSSQSSDQEGNAVYLFLNNGVTPQDLREDANDAYATATVDVQSDNSGEFSFGFLPAQTYRALFTCDAFNDDPAVIDASVEFGSPISVEVEEGQTATINFSS